MPPPASPLAYIPFVSVENMMRLVHHHGIEQVLRDLTDEIEADYRRWDLFEKAPRLASHSNDGVIELMPTSDGEVFSFKYVNGHPSNTAKGFQTVAAFGLLARVDTGYPLMLSEMTLLTALRTAATSAMVARHLAPKEARTMAMIGNGAQGRVPGVGDEGRDRRARSSPVRYRSGRDAQSCGESSRQRVDRRFVRKRSDRDRGCADHHNLHGGQGVCDDPDRQHGRCGHPHQRDRRRLSRQDRTASRHTGSRCDFRRVRTADADRRRDPADARGLSVTEFWRVLRGEAPGRTDARQITLFDSVGFAIEDFSALRYIHGKLHGSDFFHQLDMLADPDDPRDLFGMLQRAA